MNSLGKIGLGIVLVITMSDTAMSQGDRGKETATNVELLEHYFVDDLLAYFSDEYNEIDSPEVEESQYYSSINVKITKRYLKGRVGRNVRDYDGKMFSRTELTTFSAPDQSTCDQILKNLISSMDLKPPLVKPYPQGVHYPPIIIVKGSRSVVTVMYRCEDLLTEDGIEDEDSFWNQAEEIVGLIEGFKPELILVNGCGGPLRDMTDFAGKRPAEEK